MSRTTPGKTLYVIVCAAGVATNVNALVSTAQTRGWDVWIVPTPSAVDFIDIPALEKQTGHPIRARYRQPGESGKLPAADAVIVAPATYNTINKWAHGTSDTFALGLLAELTPGETPIAVLPFVNASLAANHVFTRSVAELRESSVTVLLGDSGFTPHPAGQGDNHIDVFPWTSALDAVEHEPPPASFQHLQLEKPATP
jgi:phosphopantothenoylcysteine synthetase/decarboxylase